MEFITLLFKLEVQQHEMKMLKLFSHSSTATDLDGFNYDGFFSFFRAM